eukprot:366211-Chlamydomonas_euryale.AAC.3
MHLLACTCSHAPARMHLLACPCSHAPARMHLLACASSHAPAHMHLLACTPVLHAYVHMPTHTGGIGEGEALRSTLTVLQVEQMHSAACKFFCPALLSHTPVFGHS